MKGFLVRNRSVSEFVQMAIAIVALLVALLLFPTTASAHPADGDATDGTSSLTAGTMQAMDAVKALEIFAGENRYDTARLVVSAEMTSGGPYSGVIVVAGGEGRFPDALSAAGLSGMLNYPLVVINGSGLTTENASALDTVRAKSPSGKLDILIVGGETAVSKDVASALSRWGEVSQRIAGQNRYDTNQAVYEYGTKHGAWGADYAFMATGENFPDALTIAPYLAFSRSPIVLSPKTATSLSTSGLAMISAADEVIALGGTGVVSNQLLSAAQSASKGKRSSRLDGSDRYATSVAIVKWELDHGMSLEGAGMATGGNYPDALASGFLLGKSASVLCLVSPSASDNAAMATVFADGPSPSNLRVFGGVGAVPEAVHNQIASASDWTSYMGRNLSSGATTTCTVTDIVYVTKSGEKYHRASCPSTSGKATTALSLAEAKAKGYTACKNCKPSA